MEPIKVSAVSSAMRIAVLILALLIMISMLYFALKISPNLDQLSTLKNDIQLMRGEIADSRAERNRVQSELDKEMESLRAIPREVARSLSFLEEITLARQPDVPLSQQNSRLTATLEKYACGSLVGMPTNTVMTEIYRDESSVPLVSKQDKDLLLAAAAFADYAHNSKDEKSVRTALSTLAADKSYHDLAVAAQLNVVFSINEIKGWPEGPNLVPNNTTFSIFYDLSRQYQNITPLIWLGNYERRTGASQESFAAFDAAIKLMNSKKGILGDGYEAYHGRGTERLALGIAQNKSNEFLRSIEDLDKATFLRKREGQLQVTINGTRENKGLTLVALGRYRDALKSSEDIATLSVLAWNSVVTCLAADALADRTGIELCNSRIRTFHRREFHERELVGLVPIRLRGQLDKLLNLSIQD